MLEGEKSDFVGRTRQDEEAVKTKATFVEQECKKGRGKEVGKRDVGDYSATFPLKLSTPCNTEQGVVFEET